MKTESVLLIQQEELKGAIDISWNIAPDVKTVYTNRDALIQAILIQLIHTVGVLLGCENARIDIRVVRTDAHIECIFADNRTVQNVHCRRLVNGGYDRCLRGKGPFCHRGGFRRYGRIMWPKDR